MAVRKSCGGTTYRRLISGEIPAVALEDSGQACTGRSWARGRAPAGVGRGWEAVAWLIRGGGVSCSERRQGGAMR